MPQQLKVNVNGIMVVDGASTTALLWEYKMNWQSSSSGDWCYGVGFEAYMGWGWVKDIIRELQTEEG